MSSQESSSDPISPVVTELLKSDLEFGLDLMTLEDANPTEDQDKHRKRRRTKARNAVAAVQSVQNRLAQGPERAEILRRCHQLELLVSNPRVA